MIETIFVDWDGVCTITKNFTPIWTKLSPIIGISEQKIKDAILRYDNEYLTGKINNKIFIERISSELRVKLDIKSFNELFLFEPIINIPFMELLSKLKIKFMICLLSNNFKEMKKKILLKSQNLFDRYYFSCDIGFTKKDKEFFEYILKDLKINQNKCLFIDDNSRNLNVANSLGINTIKYDSKIDDLSYIYKALKRYNILF